MFALSKLPMANLFEEQVLKCVQPCLQLLQTKAFKGDIGILPNTALLTLGGCLALREV